MGNMAVQKKSHAIVDVTVTIHRCVVELTEIASTGQVCATINLIVLILESTLETLNSLPRRYSMY